MFSGRRLLIATKHAKEKVIAPILEKALGVKCVVAENCDTDLLGTFTGETERTDDPITTARKKCLMAMELSNCEMVIASEGSFGAHPSLFFVPADDEILLFIDKKNDLEIFARELTTDTNFGGKEIRTEDRLNKFAELSKFPEHGLIIRKAKDDFSEIFKGITDWETLRKVFNDFLEKYGAAYVETDMRAMYNPTRMLAIERAAQKLADKINCYCPECDTSGFGITGIKEGLPCSLCGAKTRSALSYISTCKKCAYIKEEMYPNNKTSEDPMYCDICNP